LCGAHIVTVKKGKEQENKKKVVNILFVGEEGGSVASSLQTVLKSETGL
jgi:hypothetical protein